MEQSTLFAKALTTYDHSYETSTNFYDSFDYSRDLAVADWEKPRQVSGNVVKFYQYHISDKPHVIQNEFDVEIPAYRVIETDITDEITDVSPLSDEDAALAALNADYEEGVEMKDVDSESIDSMDSMDNMVDVDSASYEEPDVPEDDYQDDMYIQQEEPPIVNDEALPLAESF